MTTLAALNAQLTTWDLGSHPLAAVARALAVSIDASTGDPANAGIAAVTREYRATLKDLADVYDRSSSQADDLFARLQAEMGDAENI